MVSNIENVSMIPATLWGIENIIPNWGLVSYPYIKDNPEWGPNGLQAVLAVSPLSKHQQQVFEVIAYMVSEEFQLENARMGDPSVLSGQQFREQFGADNPRYVGKNLSALFALPNRRNPALISELERSIWSLDIQFPRPDLDGLTSGMKEVNEVIRTLESSLNQYMERLNNEITISREAVQRYKQRNE